MVLKSGIYSGGLYDPHKQKLAEEEPEETQEQIRCQAGEDRRDLVSQRQRGQQVSRPEGHGEMRRNQGSSATTSL